MAAGITYSPIATYTAPSAITDYTFSSIPSGYTDLILVANVKLTTSLAYMMGTYNGDTGTNYSQTSVSAGTALGSLRNSSTSVNYFTQYQNINAANFTTFIIQFMNYSNTTTHKTIIARSGNGVATSANDTVEMVVGNWRASSIAAINSIKLTFSASTVVAGSTFTLYGIAAA